MDGEELPVGRTVTMKPIGRVALAEAIALFSTLYPKFSKSLTLNPGPTTSTTRLSLPETSAKFPYKLPFAAEQQLCAMLAKISRTTAPKGATTAVCVQETDRGSLLVRIAIDQKTSAICRSKLDRIAAGFQKLFAALAQAGGTESSSSVDAPIDHALSATVSMCRERILDVAKLRTERLQDSTSLEAVISHFEKTSNHRSLVSPSRAVLCALQECAVKPSDAVLASLIIAAGCWVRTGNLLGAFTTMPTLVVEHSAAMTLLTKLATLARYEADVRALVAMARMHDAVKHLETAPLHACFPEQCPADPGDYTPNLAETLARICDKHKVDCVDTSSLARHLGRPPEALQQLFADHTTRQLNRGVIHAEAQLVSHFESVIKDKPVFPPPRVICASIQPCAFCRALVSLQNKLWMGPTDGEISVDWALSDESLGSSDGIGSRFVDELEGWLVGVLCDLEDETKGRKARDGKKPGAAEKTRVTEYMRVAQKTQSVEKTQVAEKTQAAKITQATKETEAADKTRRELEQLESGLDERRSQLEKRERKMQKTESKIQKRESEVQKREGNIQESETRLQDREEKLRTKELEVQDTEEKLRKRELEARQKNKNMQKKELEIQEAERKLQDKEKKLQMRELGAQKMKENLQKKELGLRTRQNELWEKQVEEKMRESAQKKAAEKARNGEAGTGKNNQGQGKKRGGSPGKQQKGDRPNGS